MARGRKIINGKEPATATDPPSESTPTPPPRSILPITPTPSKDHDVVKVNNASLTELKNALDDAIKRFLSRPDLFKQIHLHTDVRLALGWSGVFVAGATAFYSWRLEFEQSKPVMWIGLIVYIILTVLQTLYAYFIEGDTIFVGKRKTFDKRIVTERMTLSSRTKPSTPESPPAYTVSLTYRRSTNGGKSLLNRGEATEWRPYNAFFDERGVLDHERFEVWVGEIVGRVMESEWY
ncbi:microsomal signal peptidase 25 kDa subunit-domain-containing protein [Multifurca ochricompacta]|uniref:Signal peptidase complex subunit 2 n=1 Tax=Multifurca ochricompacta TaxID=376703 RepID=A0AAD4M558_9AGAM|nr:microsomal signal peptidase 25 kDa subunit-domain-containing protein [Multifurca ochricompacta]